MPLTRVSWGPFTSGAIDSANPLLNLRGALVRARNLYVEGASRVRLRGGSTVAMTFQDDSVTPADVTSIREIAPFGDRAIVVAHSTTTDKVYAYIVESDFTGWYDSSDTLTSDATASPTVTLWSSITAAPDVDVAEGLGVAYIANKEAADATNLNWPTRTITLVAGTWTAADLTSDLDGDSSAEALYFAGVVSYQQHLWGYGFGAGTTAANGFRPELARFSQAIFDSTGGLFQTSDSLTLGDKVRSLRERIIAHGLSGNALFLLSPGSCVRITGYGRDTWQRDILDKSYGIVGHKAGVTAGEAFYWWSNRGPMRAGDAGLAEPLWDPIASAALDALGGGDPANIVAGYDRDRDQVVWFYQANAEDGLVQFAAFDVRRNIWLGPDSSVGVEVACAGAVYPVFSVASPPAPPAAAPSLTAATSITTTSFTVNWTSGDDLAETLVKVKKHSDLTYGPEVGVVPGITDYTANNASVNTGYDVSIRHRRSGQFSVADTDTTPYATTLETLTCEAPTGVTFTANPPTFPGGEEGGAVQRGTVAWTGHEPGATHQIYMAGPSDTEPAPGAFSLWVEASAGATSKDVGPVPTTGTWWAKVRAKKSGYTSSAFAGPDSADLEAPA